MAEVRTISAADLAAGLRFATDWLGVYREQVNALNVYPVPDGDTGTNMHLTMQSVRRELDTCEEQMPQVAKALSYGALLGARGNSGVILSQLLKGFSEVIREHSVIAGSVLAKALQQASKAGYAAVMKPVEGTILSVARGVAEGAQQHMSSNAVQVLEAAIAGGQRALEYTPEQLPVLKQAGVVDSGGQGYLYVLQGLLGYLTGQALPTAPQDIMYAAQAIEHEEFGYCTEFLLENCPMDIADMRELVAPFGDSLLVVGAEGFVKGHIHTNEPDSLLATVARHGKMIRSKVEDMSEQHTEILSQAGSASRAEAQTPESGLVAVAAGQGLIKFFRSTGARIVSGGQTQNPSVQDIVDAANSVSAKEILILPNNKNVLLAAEKAKELLGEHAHVLPTRTMGQGLVAAFNFNPDIVLSELLPDMQAAITGVVTLEVTRASRSVELEGQQIQQGQLIGLRDNVLCDIGSTASPEEAVMQLIQQSLGVHEIVTIFHSVNIEASHAEGLAEQLSQAFPHCEVSTYSGSPDIYDYMVILE